MITDWLFRPITKKIIFFITFILCLGLIRNFWQLWQLTPREKPHVTSVEELEQQKQELLEKIENEKSSFSQEETIRNELNMKKEGEVILQLPPLPTITLEPEPTPTPTLKPIQAWRELFF